MTMTEFEFPWEYNFPPFFTLQKHTETRKQQFERWKDIILMYAKHNRQAVININDDLELFSNAKINRTLDRESREMVMNELCKSKNAELVGAKNSGIYEVYWLTLDEWSNVIYNWAVNCGMINSVLTFFELLNGDDTVDQQFYQLNEQVFLKALRHLEGKGKCEVMELDGNYGVKIF